MKIRQVPLHLEIDPKVPDLSEIQEVCHTIRKGGVVIFPTETFYGIGVDATSERALKRVFEIKGRDPEKPVLVLVGDPSWIGSLVMEVSPITTRLMEHFWPGGLTLLFDARPIFSPFLTGKKGKIGIRCSSHPVAMALLKKIGRPITATSANLSGEPPPSSVAEISPRLITQVDLVIDAGRTPGGFPSTVIDITTDPPAMVREGIVSIEEIEALDLTIDRFQSD